MSRVPTELPPVPPGCCGMNSEPQVDSRIEETVDELVAAGVIALRNRGLVRKCLLLAFEIGKSAGLGEAIAVMNEGLAA
jgi:hypothetical protein